MVKQLMSCALLGALLIVVGCGTAEIQPPPESIPDIPPPRGADAGPATDGGGAAAPAGRTPAMPK